MADSGKKFLSVAEMSRITGVSEDYLAKCVKTGFLTPEHHACESIEMVGGQEEEAQKCALEGRPFMPKLRTVSAQENFVTFWKSDFGKRRLCNPKMVREVINAAKGFPFNYIGPQVDAEVDKFMANIYSKMKDEDQLEILTPNKVLDALHTA